MSTSTETELLAETADGVMTLTLNRPRSLNSLTSALIDELRAQIERAAGDDDVRCVVVTGAGRAFSSGASLKDNVGAGADLEAVLVEHYNPLILAMQKLEKPIVASIRGLAVGAGASIALACDYRIMADDAKLAVLFVRIGLAPDAGASYLLPRLIGVSRAAELMMLGEDLHADKALEWGVVNKLVPADDLDAETAAVAARFAAAPRSVGLVKRLLRKTMTLNLPDQLRFEAKVQGEAGRTEDFAEGATAFLEKRKPEFSGR